MKLGHYTILTSNSGFNSVAPVFQVHPGRGKSPITIIPSVVHYFIQMSNKFIQNCYTTPFIDIVKLETIKSRY